MRSHYTLARLHHDADLSGTIEMGAETAHYLTRVLRLREGARVRLFNARDGEVAATLTTIAKKSVTMEVGERLRDPYTPPELTVFFAPLRRHRTATVLEKATELGATRIQPVITERTQFPKLDVAKMRAQVVEAAEQTERLDLPVIENAVGLFDALESWTKPVLMGDEAGDAPTLADALDGLDMPLAILTGPEGGWSPEERDRLHAMEHVHPVSLGPRILRADTAVVAILGVVQSLAGDWRT